MRLEILQVPGCPNVALLEQRLREALADHPAAVEYTRRVVNDLPTAAALNMSGSPTLLVDGVDPFAEPSLAPSVSCRLYRDEHGQAQGAPSAAALRRALGPQGDERGDPAGADASAGAEDCCTTTGAAAAEALRSWRAQTAPTAPADYAMHQQILRAFASTGAPPTRHELDEVATAFAFSASDVLARLHANDVVRLDRHGDIQVAYPFSAGPTRHRVRLTDGTQAWAMCIIDALGVAPMLGTDAVITTTDPNSGTTITATAVGGRFEWAPSTAVVFVGARPHGGPSADTCCDYLNAFTDPISAGSWTQARPDVPGATLTPQEAELLGQRIFGDLLAKP